MNFLFCVPVAMLKRDSRVQNTEFEVIPESVQELNETQNR